MSKKQNVAAKQESEPTPEEILQQLYTARAEEQAILKRGLQTFLASIENVIQLDNRIITSLQEQTKVEKKDD